VISYLAASLALSCSLLSSLALSCPLLPCLMDGTKDTLTTSLHYQLQKATSMLRNSSVARLVVSDNDITHEGLTVTNLVTLL
jgi:hypothetical protein